MEQETYSMDDVGHMEWGEPQYWYLRTDLREEMGVTSNLEAADMLREAGVIHSRNRHRSTDEHLYMVFSTEPSAQNFLGRLNQYLRTRSMVLRVEYDVDPSLVARILYMYEESEEVSSEDLGVRRLKGVIRKALSGLGKKVCEVTPDRNERVKQIEQDIVLPKLYKAS